MMNYSDLVLNIWMLVCLMLFEFSHCLSVRVNWHCRRHKSASHVFLHLTINI